MVGSTKMKMAIKIMVDLNKFDPQAVADLIVELNDKGFYHNGSIKCEEEQRKEVIAIIDKHILKKS